MKFCLEEKRRRWRVHEGMNWNSPTSDQIKNLKETFNINVELMKDGKENE